MKEGIFKLILVGLIVIVNACSNDSDQNHRKASTSENYIIQCQSDCNAVATQVRSLGGEISITYNNVNALAVKLPIVDSSKTDKLTGIKAIAKDKKVFIPQPTTLVNVVEPINGESRSLKILPGNQLAQYLNKKPANYLFNHKMTNANQLHNQNISGNGIIVAVIDSGSANNSAVVPSLAGSVIGGESMLDDPQEPSATSTLNALHGTLVAGMIAAHYGIIAPNDDILVQSIMNHAPDSVIPYEDNQSIIPMVGTAPGASIYAIKVFPTVSDSTSSSVVLFAMDRALTLKTNFNNGDPAVPVSGDGSEENPFVYDSLNIQVVNMSLGGGTLIPGLDVEDILVRKMLDSGITVVSSAGNSGFAALTTGSPSTSVASLSVGATNSYRHERILRDLQFGLGSGAVYRPNDSLQAAYFSSRGPTADGRDGVHLMANGFASFAQGADGDIYFASGTSFSAPTVAGAAALLWEAEPKSNAIEIRSALVESGNKSILDNESDTVIDRGQGFLDITSAQELLANDKTENELPDLPVMGDRPQKIVENIEDYELQTVTLDESEFESKFELQPGEVSHLLLATALDTQAYVIKVTDVKPELPKDKQNQIFGDAIRLFVVDAPTSIDDILIEETITKKGTFEVSLPQSGLLRLALLGDWKNAGRVAVKLKVKRIERKLIKPFTSGSLIDEENDVFDLEIDSKTKSVNFELSWLTDWGFYPAHDIDLLVFDPQGNIYLDGATLDIPERMTITDPQPGLWTVIVTGYMLHGFEDSYQLRIADQNNKPLKR